MLYNNVTISTNLSVLKYLLQTWSNPQLVYVWPLLLIPYFWKTNKINAINKVIAIKHSSSSYCWLQFWHAHFLLQFWQYGFFISVLAVFIFLCNSDTFYFLLEFWHHQASKIVSTATRLAGQVTWKSTCPAAKPTCPVFLYDNVFLRLTK